MTITAAESLIKTAIFETEGWGASDDEDCASPTHAYHFYPKAITRHRTGTPILTLSAGDLAEMTPYELLDTLADASLDA